MDLGDKKSVICVLDSDGEVIEETRIATTKAGLTRYFEARSRTRVVLEVGTHSPWISRHLEQFGHEVIVANAWRVKLISQNHRKGDQVDAELLARLGRADPELLAPVHHRGEDAQSDMVVIRAHAALVRSRASLLTCARNPVKSQGLVLPGCSSDAFYKRAYETLPAPLRGSLEPLLDSIKKLSLEIRMYDKRIAALCETKYPETVKPLRGCSAALRPSG